MHSLCFRATSVQFSDRGHKFFNEFFILLSYIFSRASVQLNLFPSQIYSVSCFIDFGLNLRYTAICKNVLLDKTNPLLQYVVQSLENGFH